MDPELLVYTGARMDPELLVYTGANTKTRIPSCIELKLKLTFTCGINMSK